MSRTNFCPKGNLLGILCNAYTIAQCTIVHCYICSIQTPSKPAPRGKGRRGKASLASTSASTLSSTVEEDSSKTEAEPQKGRVRRATRQSRLVDKYELSVKLISIDLKPFLQLSSKTDHSTIDGSPTSGTSAGFDLKDNFSLIQPSIFLLILSGTGGR